MADTTRQLTVNITITNEWTKLLDLETSLAYTVPSGKRSDVKWASGVNYGANAATVELAISSGSTISDAARVWPPVSLAQYEQRLDERLMVIPATFGLWARAVGTTPNMTVQATILEVTV